MAGRRTSAFALKTLSQSRIVVGLWDNALAWMKCARPRRIAGHGQVAQPDNHPDDAHLRLGRGVDHLYLKGDQQVKLLAEFVIPEFRAPVGCTLLDEGNMRVIARIGQDDPPEKHQKTHPALRLEAVVMPQLILKRRGYVLGSGIQPLVAFLRLPRLTESSVLLDLRPERLVGGSHLPGIEQAICAGILKRLRISRVRPKTLKAIGDLFRKSAAAGRKRGSGYKPKSILIEGNWFLTRSE